MTTVADIPTFRRWFPDLDGVDDATLERLLDEATQLHSINPTCTLYAWAHLAYLESFDPGDPGKGEISSESLGPMSISYVPQAERGWQSFFTSSRYGRKFLILERRTPRTRLSMTVVG